MFPTNSKITPKFSNGRPSNSTNAEKDENSRERIRPKRIRDVTRNVGTLFINQASQNRRAMEKPTLRHRIT